MIDPIQSPDETPKPDMDLNDALAELAKGGQPKRRIVRPAASLTQSQTLAADQLETLFRLKLLGASAGGIHVRTHALLCGASGAGKTTAVRLFASQFGLPVFSATVGSWTPWGARHDVPGDAYYTSFVDDKN